MDESENTSPLMFFSFTVIKCEQGPFSIHSLVGFLQGWTLVILNILTASIYILILHSSDPTVTG